MSAGVLITNGDENGGVHPPEKWAKETTRHILMLFDVPENASAVVLADLNAFKAKLPGILTPHHGKVQDHVRDGIGKGKAHTDPSPHVGKPVDEVIAAAAGTTLAPVLARPEAREAIARILERHFQAVMDIEHQWHEHRLEGRAHPEHMARFGHIQNPAARRA